MGTCTLFLFILCPRFCAVLVIGGYYYVQKKNLHKSLGDESSGLGISAVKAGSCRFCI